ncbi:hypothetical protein [Klebsiella pasteurii]|uniref:hypothetical protein n=1 Tax=Klebsiella pasteurii TaxID=2587529 RepID=UPI00292DB05F|nr:hypothetical protein [Klebsiella pasteurii]
MNIETVNELIQSLESAGELSIKERKYLELAKAYQQLAAENVGLKKFIQTDCFVAHIEPETFYEEEVTRYVSADGYEPETPATDRIVASIKADGRAEGINFAASRLAAAFNHGHVDKSMAEVGDVVRMILTAKEYLANDPALPADGLSGEYAEKSLTEWEAVLREGADK